MFALRQFGRPTGDDSAHREHGCAHDHDCVHVYDGARGHDDHDQRQTLLGAGAAGQPDGKRRGRQGGRPRSGLAGKIVSLPLGVARIWVLRCGVLGKPCDFLVLKT